MWENVCHNKKYRKRNLDYRHLSIRVSQYHNTYLPDFKNETHLTSKSPILSIVSSYQFTVKPIIHRSTRTIEARMSIYMRKHGTW